MDDGKIIPLFQGGLLSKGRPFSGFALLQSESGCVIMTKNETRWRVG